MTNAAEPKLHTAIVTEADEQKGVADIASLPKDLTDSANDRLGLLAFALTAVGIFSYAYNYLISFLIPDQSQADYPNAIILFIIALSALMAFVAHRRAFNEETLHRLGIAYVILVALLIVISSTSSEWWIVRVRLQGVSWVCVWIVLFPLVVPCPTIKASIIAMVMAMMGPVGLFIATMFLGKAAATFTAYLDLFIPNVISAVMAVFISRVIYRLGKEVQSARRMGSYNLQHKLGAGGMGEVWQATHRMLTRPAAIKLIHPEILELSEFQEKQAKERFFHEANTTSSLTSPHTVRLYDFGITDDSTFYFVMELLNGDDLSWLVKRYGTMPSTRVVYFLIQICESLAEAHNAGLIHRDIKPANIFVCHIGMQYDFIKVLDFGLAKSIENIGQHSKSNRIEGTPEFMAPEAFSRNTEISNSVDIYALGCVAYWLLTAKYVFEKRTDMSTTLSNAGESPIPPSELINKPIPNDLEELIMACLATNPDERPESAEVLAERLSRCDIGENWTNQKAKEWWQRYSSDFEKNVNTDIDPEATTEVG